MSYLGGSSTHKTQEYYNNCKKYPLINFAQDFCNLSQRLQKYFSLFMFIRGVDKNIRRSKKVKESFNKWMNELFLN